LSGKSKLTNVQTQGKQKSAQPAAPRRRRKQPNVTVQLGKAEETIPVTDLKNPESFSAWQRRLQEYQGKPHFRIRDLQRLHDETRYNLFLLITSHASHTVTIGNERDNKGLNLFGAVLGAIDGDASIEQQGCMRRAAVEAAALCYPAELPFVCDRIVKKFREVGVRGILPQSLVKDARALLGESDARVAADQGAREFLNSRRSGLMCEGNETFNAETLATLPVVAFYCDELFYYTGTHWRKVSHKEFNAQVTASLQQADHGDQVTTKFVGDVMTNVVGMTLLPQGDHSPPLWLDEESPRGFPPSPYIAFENGLVDLDEALEATATLSEHDPRHFSTTVLPYAFDPAAECPLWRETLRDIFRARPLRRPRPLRQLRDRRERVLQEFFGYSLLKHNMQFEKCLVLFGEGANGKSTITKTWIKMLGVNNVSHVPLDKIGGEFWLVRMIDMHANIVADMNFLDRVEEGIFKALVSGDELDANRKNLSQVRMKPTAKLVFATNVLPPFKDRTNGSWRRLITMPLFACLEGEDCDRQRADRLIGEELPGIFNWALEGARRLRQQSGFTTCQVCQRALNQHRFDSDPVRQFVSECTHRGDDRFVRKTDLYGAYHEWCDNNGRHPCASSEFGKHIVAMPGITVGRETTGSPRPRTYVGIGLVRPFVPRLSLRGQRRG
jgi:P4 family phage/plasmid primase-like protien